VRSLQNAVDAHSHGLQKELCEYLSHDLTQFTIQTSQRLPRQLLYVQDAAIGLLVPDTRNTIMFLHAGMARVGPGRGSHQRQRRRTGAGAGDGEPVCGRRLAGACLP
jgi:hypothetical protein